MKMSVQSENEARRSVEMVLPLVTPRMKKLGDRACLQIDPCQVGAFV